MKYIFACCALLSVVSSAGNLVAVFPAGSTDLDRLGTMNLDLYARLDDSYVGVITPGQAAVLDQYGITYRELGPVPTQGDFYIVAPPADMKMADARHLVSDYAGVLFEHSGSFFVVGSPAMIEYLPSRRCHITRVNRRPIVFNSSFRPEPASPSRYNAVVKWVIDQITPGELARLVRDLSGENAVVVGGRTDTIRSRYTYNVKNSVALKYYYEKMQSYGVDSIAYHLFNADSNVIATRVGRVYPRRQYLIGGHIDDVPSSGNAPGADDNATGTIAGLIAAKYIRGIPFKHTIKFVAWNAEEQGLIGSDYYAGEAAGRGDSIRGYLNGDMLAYETSSMDYIWCYNAGRPGSVTISNKFVQMNTDYSLALRVRVSTQAPSWSDMYSFWINGYDAICNIESDNNPYYHTTSDRITTLDTLYFCRVVKCMVATLLELAEPDTLFPGVAEESPGALAGSRLTVHPNPARRSVQFTINGLTVKMGELAIYDATGKLVTGVDQPVLVNQPVTLELPAGVYFAKCRLDGSTITRKFVMLE